MCYLLRKVGFLVSSGSKLVLIEVWHGASISEDLYPNWASCVVGTVKNTSVYQEVSGL